MTIRTAVRPWLAAAILMLLAATAAVYAQPPAAPYLNAAPPPGMARIWFFRDLNPNETLAMAYIRLNGSVAGVSEAGRAFYRAAYFLPVTSGIRLLSDLMLRGSTAVPGLTSFLIALTVVFVGIAWLILRRSMRRA